MNWHEKQVKSQQSSLGGLQCRSETTWEKTDSEGIGLGIVTATAKCSSRNSNSEANNAAPSGSRKSLLGSKLKFSVSSNQPLFPAQNNLGSSKVPSKSLHANMTSPHTHLNSLHTQTSSLTAQLKSPHLKSSHTYLNSPNAQSRFSHEQSKQIRIGMEHSESYTSVTFHGPKSSTKHIYTHFSVEGETLQFPVREQYEQGTWDVALSHQSYVNVPIFHSAYFLSACYFCKQQLNHGNDIYMYSGDKAFCSVECRYQQILLDEGKETFPASPPSSSNVSSHFGRFFSTSTATAA